MPPPSTVIPSVTATLEDVPYAVRFTDDQGNSWRADEPQDVGGGNDIVRRITLQGALSEEQRAQLLKTANACPMHKLLSGEIRIATSLERLTS